MLWRLLRSERCRVTKVPAEADLFVVPVWPRPKNQSGWAAACDKDANRKLAEALVHMTPGTAHKHLIIIGKGQINPSGKCDDWWRSPRGLLRRAMRVATLRGSGGAGERGAGTFLRKFGQGGGAAWRRHLATSGSTTCCR